MKITAVFLPLLTISASFAAPEQHATATWLSSEEPATTEGAVRTVIRMVVDEGWHTYWKNPGEGGMPVSIDAELPEGWSLGEIQYPVPKRFVTGELPGFGYEGEILFPLTLTPPENFEGELPSFSATLSWLTCNDQSCVPGKSELQLSDTANGELIETAFDSLPKPLPDVKMKFLVAEDFLQITLVFPDGAEIDPSSFTVFPATPDVIDPAAKPSFRKSPTTPHTWIATAPKSEYLSGTPENLTLVLKDKDGTSYEISSN